MISIFGYLAIGFFLGFLTCSIDIAMTVFVIVQYFIAWPIGIGWTSVPDAMTYDAASTMAMAIAGMLMAFTFGAPDALRTRFIRIAKENEPEIRDTESKRSSLILRWIKAILVSVVFVGEVAVFEFYSATVWTDLWCSLIVLIVAVALFWFLFQGWSDTARNEKSHRTGFNRFIHDEIYAHIKSDNKVGYSTFWLMLGLGVTEFVALIICMAFLHRSSLADYFVMTIVAGLALIGWAIALIVSYIVAWVMRNDGHATAEQKQLLKETPAIGGATEITN
jgi:hypothetical protein